MKIAYENENVQLWHGDCQEWSGKADAVVSDPPYPDCYTEEYAYDEDRIVSAFALPVRQFVFWSGSADFPMDHTAVHIWNKNPSNHGAQYERVFERNGGRHRKVWTRYMVNSTVAAQMTRDVFTEHPSQKPIALLRDIVSELPDGCTVLDPFCGSGTTMIAALETGRKAIGIEIDERWVEVARRRLERWHAQPRFDFMNANAPRDIRGDSRVTVHATD